METENTTSNGSESTTETTSTETSGAEISSLDSTQGSNEGSNEASNPGSQTDSATQPAWTPNYEFTVKDKKHQIDDIFKPLITSKDVEAKMKELYEKSYGLDEVKASRESFKERLTVAENEINQTRESLQMIGDLIKKQDFSTFFEILKIPKDQILNYAVKEFQFQQLPAEQQAEIERQRRQEREFYQAQNQNQTLQSQLRDLQVAQARNELNMELSKPEVTSLVQAFDAKLNQPGAFMAEVIRRGQYYEAVLKTSPPVSQLVAEVAQFVGMQTPSPQGTPAPQAIPSQGVVSPQAQPVIPAFNGSVQKSPVKKTPSSLQDLRDIRKQL